MLPLPPLTRWAYLLARNAPTLTRERCERCDFPFSAVSIEGLAGAWAAHMRFAHPEPSAVEQLWRARQPSDATRDTKG